VTGSSLFLSSAMVHEGVTRRSEAALSDVTLTGISAVVEKLIGFVYSLPLFVVPVWYRRCDDDVFRFVRGEGKKRSVVSVFFRGVPFVAILP